MLTSSKEELQSQAECNNTSVKSKGLSLTLGEKSDPGAKHFATQPKFQLQMLTMEASLADSSDKETLSEQSKHFAFCSLLTVILLE